jgi:acetylornithine deacetylase/succinyl-diaminopimelate desuccinylase-like protein
MRLDPSFDFLKTIHGPDERIPVDTLRFGSEVLYQLLASFGQERRSQNGSPGLE